MLLLLAFIAFAGAARPPVYPIFQSRAPSIGVDDSDADSDVVEITSFAAPPPVYPTRQTRVASYFDDLAQVSDGDSDVVLIASENSSDRDFIDDGDVSDSPTQVCSMSALSSSF
jgi:hypothetical protein